MKKNSLVFLFLVAVLLGVVIVGFFNEGQLSQDKTTIKTLVTDAVDAIQVGGESVFSEFREEGSRWFNGETYVFVWKTDGIRVVYPPDRSGEGQNMTSLIDVNGKPIGKLFIDIATSQSGEGWIEYSWPKLGEFAPLAKETYIRAADFGNQTYLVGSGVYSDGFVSAFVVPLQYIAIVLEGMIASAGLFLAVKRRRIFGYGIFLTFAIYVFYDLARLIPLDISNSTLYPVFFVATLSMLWAVIVLSKENKKALK